MPLIYPILKVILQDEYPGNIFKRRVICKQCARCIFGKKCKVGCSAMAISSSDSLGDNTYCVRRMEEKRLLQELFN